MALSPPCPAARKWLDEIPSRPTNVNRHDINEIAKAIAALNLWEKAAAHNWALVPQTSELPYLVNAMAENKKGSPVIGRLHLFPGFVPFRDFMISRRVTDFGVGMSPMDFDHFELVSAKGGVTELFVYEPGFVPRALTDDERAFLAPLLYECYGLMLRLDENPDLPLAYVKENALFARKEMSENVWIDGPLKLPDERQNPYTEQVSLNKAKCAAAAKLPMAKAEKWEVDFVMVPSYQTREARSRFLYVLAAVDAATGERRVWEKMSVDGKPGGLKRLWEAHAQRMLDRILVLGRVPGELHVRTGRVMRFLRPLGLQLPFKLVQHAKLQTLDAVLELAVRSGTV